MDLDIIFKTYYSRLYRFKWESDPDIDFNFVYIGESNRHFTQGKTYTMFSITSEPYNVRLLDDNQQIRTFSGDVFSELFLTKGSWRERQLDNILQ
jgi:hypothetical protein